MRGIIISMLLAIAVMLPRVASASYGGCGRHDRGVVQVTLAVAFVLTAAALVVRRRRII